MGDTINERKKYGPRLSGRPRFKSDSKGIGVDLANAIARAHAELTGRPIRLSKAKREEYAAAGLDMKLFGKR